MTSIESRKRRANVLFVLTVAIFIAIWLALLISSLAERRKTPTLGVLRPLEVVAGNLYERPV